MPKKNSGKTYYPYARIKAMNEIIKFIQSPNWHPEKISRDVLKMLNIGASKADLVVAALRFLDLINSSGCPTDKFDALKTNYKSELESLVRGKYAALFSILPGELIDQERVVNFFMTNSKTSRDTAEYQGMFFGWACREAGIELPNLPESFKRARFNK